MEQYEVICIGTGEIGKPLYELFNGVYKTLPIDPVRFSENTSIQAKCDYLHICIPGALNNFSDVVSDYIEKYKPHTVCIHSTVPPGTTRGIGLFVDAIVIHTPVHGKHRGNSMKKDMLRYPKYLGVPEGLPDHDIKIIVEHFSRVGFYDIRPFRKPETTEWLKVLSTTYFGLQIAWAQEVERICNKFNLDYNEVSDFFSIQEDAKTPAWPGVIKGHCVMPNIDIIQEVYDSIAADFIRKSNDLKEK